MSGAESAFGGRASPDWGPNIVEGNLVWQVSQASGDITGQGIQIAADAIVRNNIVYAPQPFYNSNHQCLAGNLEIVGNTFISSTAEEKHTLKLHNVPSGPILIANNALYRGPGRTDVITGAGSTSAWVTMSGNVAVLDLPTAFADAPGLDFFPIPGSPLIGRANPAYQPATDFNGTSRAGDWTAGAYVFDPAGNPGH